MRNCMICSKESNLEISLCKSCYDIQLEINIKNRINKGMKKRAKSKKIVYM